MASEGFFAFSPNGDYLAHCGYGGKLKIWETTPEAKLKHEYTPSSHLSSPCSTLGWIVTGSHSTATSTMPKKKKKKKSISEEFPDQQIVAMGSVKGVIYLYNTSTATVFGELKENGHTGKVTALTWSNAQGLFTASENQNIIQWNVHDKCVKNKWTSNKGGLITAIAVAPSGKSLLTAGRVIKWWDLETRQVICKFTKQASQITSLRCIQMDTEKMCVVSGSSDTHLDVWSLNENEKSHSSVATLAAQEEPTSVSVKMDNENQLNVLVSTKSGNAHLFRYFPNGGSRTPIKPTLSVGLLSESSQKGGTKVVPILGGDLTSHFDMLFACGSFDFNIVFRKVTPKYSQNVQYEIMKDFDVKKTKHQKEESGLLKVSSTDMEKNVEYLVTGASGVGLKRTKTSGVQLPFKNRLENLSLNDVKNTSNVEVKGESMVQLLIQGLQSKEKSILEQVLYTPKEHVIENTVAKLPIQAIIPLCKELNVMLQGKTRPCKIAVMWLKELLLKHAGQLISHPDMVDSLSPILSLIDAKLTLLPDILRLKGRVGLVTNQIAVVSDKKHQDISQDALLVYQDPDSSDDDSDDSDASGSESDENWAEFSDLDAQDDEENDQYISKMDIDDNDDDNASMCS